MSLGKRCLILKKFPEVLDRAVPGKHSWGCRACICQQRWVWLVTHGRGRYMLAFYAMKLWRYGRNDSHTKS